MKFVLFSNDSVDHQNEKLLCMLHSPFKNILSWHYCVSGCGWGLSSGTLHVPLCDHHEAVGLGQPLDSGASSSHWSKSQLSGVAEIRITTSKSLAMVLSQKMVECPLWIRDELLPHVEEGFVHKLAKRETIDRQKAAAAAVPVCHGEESFKKGSE